MAGSLLLIFTSTHREISFTCGPELRPPWPARACAGRPWRRTKRAGRIATLGTCRSRLKTNRNKRKLLRVIRWKVRLLAPRISANLRQINWSKINRKRTILIGLFLLFAVAAHNNRNITIVITVLSIFGYFLSAVQICYHVIDFAKI